MRGVASTKILLATASLFVTVLACDYFETVPATFEVTESVEQLHVTGAEPDTHLAVYDAEGRLVAKGTTDEWGSLMLRELAPGDGYLVRERFGRTREQSGPHVVMSAEESQPDPSFYASQVLQPGFNYITTRDGTQLSAYVQLPGPPENGPYPTLVNYSGYEPSKPGEPLDVPDELKPLVANLCAGLLPVLCDAPNHPSGIIGGIFRYATVGVNLRGTGCSGGAYDYFETMQVLDGYDMIEVIAAQPWVLNNKVGMAGLSYPGISQLFVAQTRPPSLAAITPLSVIAETTASTLAPGGIFNNGFAFEWSSNVYENAQPYGQGWEQDQVDREAELGITTCADNQRLHAQSVDSTQKALDNAYYTPELADPLNPKTFIDQIDVPVLLTGAWQDEQTGPHFATMLDGFINAPSRRFIVFNGLHPDGYSPETLAEWKAFNDIYIANKVPRLNPVMNLVAGFLFKEIFGRELLIPPLPFRDAATVEEARAAWEAQDEVRVIFERGAADELYPTPEDPEGGLGAPVGTFDASFASWPPPETVAERLYFNEDGSLRPTLPSEQESSSAFAHDPAAGERTLGGKQPFYEWAATPPGSAVVFVSDPLSEDTVYLGSGSVDLWIQSTAADADLEVLLSEVRDDGQEMYVQAGWLRASHRALAPDATELRPVKTHLEEDAAPLERKGWTLARVELFPFGHIFRAGSRIRIQVDTPGDSRERWKFMLLEFDEDVTHYVSHSADHPSSVVLPLIPGIEVPTDPPPCPSLRGQPCRTFDVAYLNVLEEPPMGRRHHERDWRRRHRRDRDHWPWMEDWRHRDRDEVEDDDEDHRPYAPGRGVLKDWPRRQSR